MDEDTKQVSMFDAEYKKLQEVLQKILTTAQEKCGNNTPPALRIAVDNLNIAGCMMQQLEGYLNFVDSAAEKAAADLATGGKGVVSG